MLLSNFKKVKVCEKATTRLIQRQFAILSTAEEFPLSTNVTPKKAIVAPVAIQKSTLENGIKVVSYDRGNSKVCLLIYLNFLYTSLECDDKLTKYIFISS